MNISVSKCLTKATEKYNFSVEFFLHQHKLADPTQPHAVLTPTRPEDPATSDPSSQSSGVELFSSSSSPGEEPPLPQPLAKWMLKSL